MIVSVIFSLYEHELWRLIYDLRKIAAFFFTTVIFIKVYKRVRRKQITLVYDCSDLRGKKRFWFSSSATKTVVVEILHSARKRIAVKVL